jgi:hypothetical protein
MSDLGQSEKNSVRANVFRATPESGHRSIQPACLKGASFALDGKEIVVTTIWERAE